MSRGTKVKLTYRYHVPPGGPVSPEVLERLEMKPLPGGSFDDERLIQGPGEEQGCEPEDPGGVDEADGPVPHEMQGAGDGDGGVGREQVQRHEGAEGRR